MKSPARYRFNVFFVIASLALSVSGCGTQTPTPAAALPAEKPTASPVSPGEPAAHPTDTETPPPTPTTVNGGLVIFDWSGYEE